MRAGPVQLPSGTDDLASSGSFLTASPITSRLNRTASKSISSVLKVSNERPCRNLRIFSALSIRSSRYNSQSRDTDQVLFDLPLGARLEPSLRHEVHRSAEQRLQIILQPEIPVERCRSIELHQHVYVTVVAQLAARGRAEQREPLDAEPPRDLRLPFRQDREDLFRAFRHRPSMFSARRPHHLQRRAHSSVSRTCSAVSVGSLASGTATIPFPCFFSRIGVGAISISRCPSPARISSGCPGFKPRAWRSGLGTTIRPAASLVVSTVSRLR